MPYAHEAATSVAAKAATSTVRSIDIAYKSKLYRVRSRGRKSASNNNKDIGNVSTNSLKERETSCKCKRVIGYLCPAGRMREMKE